MVIVPVPVLVRVLVWLGLVVRVRVVVRTGLAIGVVVLLRLVVPSWLRLMLLSLPPPVLHRCLRTTRPSRVDVSSRSRIRNNNGSPDTIMVLQVARVSGYPFVLRWWWPTTIILVFPLGQGSRPTQTNGYSSHGFPFMCTEKTPSAQHERSGRA